MKSLILLVASFFAAQSFASSNLDMAIASRLVDSCDLADASGGDMGRKVPSKIEVHTIYGGQLMYAKVDTMESTDEGTMQSVTLPNLSVYKADKQDKTFGEFIKMALSSASAISGMPVSQLRADAYVAISFNSALNNDYPEAGFIKVYAKSGTPAGVIYSMGSVGLAFGHCQ